VSTDFDISDKLYFEPLTFEDVVNIYETEKPEGVIVQFGGQTPLNLSSALEKAGVKILGTSSDSIDLAEDRERFQKLLKKLELRQPENGLAVTFAEAKAVANKVTYPVVVRPSYVLGGAAMEIVFSDQELEKYIANAIDVSPERPILIDKYLEEAIEVDVDALADGKECVIAGVMEHIEEAGIHSGDSACALPPFSLEKDMIEEIKIATKKLAKELKVIGLLNIQFAVRNNQLYVLEVNPRASRTAPFVSKATGIPWAKMATKVILGKSIKELGLKEVIPKHVSVKEAVFPFNKFPEVDILLGPEMKSTGEVMGIDKDFGLAYLKSQIAAGQKIPASGTIFISVRDSDKSKIVPIAKEISMLGFNIVATKGTAEFLCAKGIKAGLALKVLEGRPNIVDSIINNDIVLIINTPSGKNPLKDEVIIRQSALKLNIPVVTTIAGAIATAHAMKHYLNDVLNVKSIQEYNA
jgi:carbamoyl-phosphate synthase large subunit